MALRFSDRAAIISGAGTGIGFEIAHQLVKDGANVILNDIDGDLAKTAAESLSAIGPGMCVAVRGDAGDIDCINQMIAKAVHHFGRLDMAIANAGNTLFGNFFDLTVEDFQKVINLNLRGPFFMTQLAARQMRSQGFGGRVILMSSTIGLLAYPHLSLYSTTKAALHMMAKSLVFDLSFHGITINAIAPGATVTERTLLEDAEYEKKWSELIPDKKAAFPGDIAKAALFLLSDDANHITGQTLVVDGGWSSSGQNPDAANLQEVNGAYYHHTKNRF